MLLTALHKDKTVVKADNVGLKSKKSDVDALTMLLRLTMSSDVDALTLLLRLKVYAMMAMWVSRLMLLRLYSVAVRVTVMLQNMVLLMLTMRVLRV
jgi:hypothetical protein